MPPGPITGWIKETISNLSSDVQAVFQSVTADTVSINNAPSNADEAVRKNEFDTHAGSVGVHHSRYTDEEAQDAVGSAAGDGLSYDDAANTLNATQSLGGAEASVSSSYYQGDSYIKTLNLGESSYDDGNLDLLNDNYTTPEAGIYLIYAQIEWLSDSTWSTGDSIRLYPAVNGSFIQRNKFTKAGTGTQLTTCTTAFSAAAGDTVRIDLYQNSGASQRVGTNSQVGVLRVA